MDSEYATTQAKKPLPPPNPVTQAAHKREVRRQVLLPLIFVLLALIGIGVWVIWAGIGSAEQWAQIAQIGMLLMGLVLGLILLVIALGVLFLISYVLGIIPPYARVAQDAIRQIDQQVKSGSDIPVKPVIEIQKFIAMMDVLVGRRKEER